MGDEAAVGVHHELAACESCIRIKAPQHKFAAGIDEDHCIRIQREVGKDRAKDLFPNSFSQFLHAHICFMLAGHHHSGHPMGLAVLVFHRYLGFSV